MTIEKFSLDLKGIILEDYEDQEVEVSISYIFWSVLKRWRAILIVTLIGCIIGFGFSRIPVDISKMSDSDVQRIESFISMNNLYNSSVEKAAKSPFLSMPYEKLNKIQTVYSSTTTNPVVIDKAEVFLKDFNSDKNFWKPIAAEFSWDADKVEEMKNFISFSTSVKVNESLSTSSKTVFETITVLGLEEESEKISEFVNKLFEDYCLNGEVCDMELVSSTASETPVSEYQQKANDEMSRAFQIIAKMDDTLNGTTGSKVSAIKDINISDEQAAYIKQYHADEFEVDEPGFVKETVIGFLIGFVLAALVVAVKALVSETISFTADVSYKFNIPVLAQVNLNKKRGLDKAFYNLTHSKTYTSTDLSYAENAVKSSGSKKTVVCCNPDDKEEVECQKNLVAKNKDLFVPVALISNCKDSYSKMLEADSAVLVIHMDKTPVKAIKEQLEVLKANNVKVLGTVAVVD